jgi:hypothetical protein
MKKLFSYHIILLAFIAMLVSCKKEGPMGPEGPEGPAGNPGANSSGGGGTGTVKVYTSDLALDVFRWTANGFVKGLFTLYRSQGAAGSGDPAYYVPDPDDEIPDAVILVYLQMKKGTTAAPWYHLPYLVGNSSAGYESFTASTYYQDQGSGRSYLRVGVTAEVTQLSPAAATPPSYEVKGLRVVVIPAGDSEETGRAAMPDINMTFEEVVERYKLQEKNFKKL